MPLYKQQQGCQQQPTLVFIHGFLGSSLDWQETINLLAPHFHCISIDLPGHGASVATTCSRKDGFAHCHQLIKNVLDDLDVKQYSLIGYSLGGRIALDYARTQNDPRLKALVLESSHTGFSLAEQKENRLIHDQLWAFKFATQHITETLWEWYEQSIFSDLKDLEIEGIIEQRTDNYGVPLANTLLATSLSKQTDALPYLKEVAFPVYYCFGEKDKKFKQLAKQFDHLPHINCVEFENAGHNIHQHNAQQFSQFILQNLTHL